jgi:hypothetical protein
LARWTASLFAGCRRRDLERYTKLGPRQRRNRGLAYASGAVELAVTVREFLAGLAKKGITVTVLDRVRQVGPGKEGAKGSYTAYRIAEAG